MILQFTLQPFFFTLHYEGAISIANGRNRPPILSPLSSRYATFERNSRVLLRHPWNRVSLKRMTSNVGDGKYIIAAPTKMGSSASSMQVTLLFSCFIQYIHGLTFSVIKIKAEPVSIGSSS